jgi:hypothetical protein
MFHLPVIAKQQSCKTNTAHAARRLAGTNWIRDWVVLTPGPDLVKNLGRATCSPSFYQLSYPRCLETVITDRSMFYEEIKKEIQEIIHFKKHDVI